MIFKLFIKYVNVLLLFACIGITIYTYIYINTDLLLTDPLKEAKIINNLDYVTKYNFDMKFKYIGTVPLFVGNGIIVNDIFTIELDTNNIKVKVYNRIYNYEFDLDSILGKYYFKFLINE